MPIKGIVFGDLLGHGRWQTNCRNEQKSGIYLIAHIKEGIGFIPVLTHPDEPGNNIDNPQQSADKVSSCQPGHAPDHGFLLVALLTIF